jgi:putative heme iron utilization protein
MSITPEELKRIMDHMNDDHEESLILYAHAFADRKDVTSAKMVDLTSSEIVLELESGERLEVTLTSPVITAKDAHVVLVDMHKQAAMQMAN